MPRGEGMWEVGGRARRGDVARPEEGLVLLSYPRVGADLDAGNRSRKPVQAFPLWAAAMANSGLSANAGDAASSSGFLPPGYRAPPQQPPPQQMLGTGFLDALVRSLAAGAAHWP